MGFLKRLLTKNSIVKVEIFDHEDGLDEDEKLDNLIIGDTLGDFDGMMAATIYNDYNSAETTFKITYKDDSIEYVTTKDGDSNYNFYMQYIKE